MPIERLTRAGLFMVCSALLSGCGGGGNSRQTFSSIAAGATHTIALKSSGGSLWTWGDNSQGELGSGTIGGNTAAPAVVGTGFKFISAGSAFNLAVKADGTLWSWGSNVYGQLGNGTTSPTPTGTPTQVIGGFHSNSSFSYVAAGTGTAFAIQTDGSLWAWGLNNSGQLGDGTNLIATTPTQVGTNFSQVFPGASHTLAIQSSGALMAWGNNFYGQLGLGNPSANVESPAFIGNGYSTAAAGDIFSAAVKTDGTLWAWGNYDPNGTPSPTPVQLGSGFSTVVAGQDFAIALKADGSLWAWGSNADSQLGDGTTTSRSLPVQIGSGYQSVAANGHHAAAIKSDHTVWVWGDNSLGQLGDGTTVTRSTPTQLTVP